MVEAIVRRNALRLSGGELEVEEEEDEEEFDGDADDLMEVCEEPSLMGDYSLEDASSDDDFGGEAEVEACVMPAKNSLDRSVKLNTYNLLNGSLVNSILPGTGNNGQPSVPPRQSSSRPAPSGPTPPHTWHPQPRAPPPPASRRAPRAGHRRAAPPRAEPLQVYRRQGQHLPRDRPRRAPHPRRLPPPRRRTCRHLILAAGSLPLH
jgi:hypothetical protein